MIASRLKPYHALKESGVAWLREVPTHWKTTRAKSLFAKLDRPVTSADEVVTCFRDGTVTLRKNRRTSGFTESLKEIGYQGVRRGDLVIHTMDAFAGACGVSDSNGKCTPVYSVCAPRHGATNSHYYAFCIREMARSQWILALSRGVRKRSTDFRFAAFGDQMVPVPPSLEQAAIVRFLAHADRRIRGYMRAKEKLIELLEEQKQAMMHQAVTGQIDVRTGEPYPAYKNSGVAWLRDVPEHWQLVPNRTMLSRRRVLVGEDHTQFNLLSLTKVGVIVRDVSAGRGKFSADMGTSQEVRSGDLVFCLFDVPETPRTVGLSNHDGMITGAYTVFECDRPLLRRFLEAFYIAMDDRKLLQPLYSGLRNTIPPSRLLAAKTPIPPRDEQAAILAHLDVSGHAAESATTLAKREVELLDEYRIRLIADVVTGKLDVREAAASLPSLDPFEVHDRRQTLGTGVAMVPEESTTAVQPVHP